MPKITDEQYRYLSRAVYFVGKFPHQYRKGRMVTIHGRKYVVEDVESNEKNGLQALAVTPKDDLNELVIAYGGTDPADIRDALTDIEFIALGREHRPPGGRQGPAQGGHCGKSPRTGTHLKART